MIGLKARLDTACCMETDKSKGGQQKYGDSKVSRDVTMVGIVIIYSGTELYGTVYVSITRFLLSHAVSNGV